MRTKVHICVSQALTKAGVDYTWPALRASRVSRGGGGRSASMAGLDESAAAHAVGGAVAGMGMVDPVAYPVM